MGSFSLKKPEVQTAVWMALFGAALGLAPGHALAQVGGSPGALADVLCYILDNFKMALAFATIVFVLLSWIGSKLDSEKLMSTAIGFAVGMVVIFALIWGIKRLGWANSLACIASF